MTDYDSDRIDLSWSPPEKDGGAPIDKYIVEKKDPGSRDWVTVMEVKEPKAIVKGLKEGTEYQFRVKAVNKAGIGQPSDPSERQLAKPRFSELSHHTNVTFTTYLQRAVR